MSTKLYKASKAYVEARGWEFLGYIVAEDSELIVYHDGHKYHVSLVEEGWDETILTREEVERMLMACRDILHNDDRGSGIVVFSVIMLDIRDNHAMVKHAFQGDDSFE